MGYNRTLVNNIFILIPSHNEGATTTLLLFAILLTCNTGNKSKEHSL
jgi:hypothetical protein